MDFLDMLKDYKAKGSRVDEVLYHTFCEFLTMSREKWTNAESRAFQKTMQLGLARKEIERLEKERDMWKKEAESWKLDD